MPLPYPYWNIGAEVPGAQPYVSGEPPTPAYVAPPGYVVTSVQQVQTGPRPPVTVQEALHPPPEQQVEVMLAPKTYETRTQLFGIKEYEWNPETGILTEIVYTTKGQRIRIPTRFATFPEIVSGKATLTPHQQSALLGMGLTTVVATGVAVPAVGAFAVGGVTVAEIGKVTITGEHLTVPEAISAAGVGEMVGAGALMGARAFQPRVQRGLESSYRQAVEAGELWKPTFAQKISMKVTGAQPPRLAQEIVGAGEPRGVSLAMLKKGETLSIEEAYFWEYPTPRSAQVYLRSPEPRVKAWAVGTLVRRVYIEGLFTTTLRTGLITETEKVVKPEMPYIPKEPYITRAESVTPLPISFTALGIMQATRTRTVQITRKMQRQALMQESKQAVAVSQVLGTAQTQRQAQQQRQMLGLTQTQVQKQAQRQILGTPVTTPTVTVPKTFIPAWFRAGGEAGTRSFERLFGRFYPRTHKIKTWEQQLKTFGLGGKIPKSLSKLGKMEVPSFTTKRKRRRKKKR